MATRLSQGEILSCLENHSCPNCPMGPKPNIHATECGDCVIQIVEHQLRGEREDKPEC